MECFPTAQKTLQQPSYSNASTAETSPFQNSHSLDQAQPPTKPNEPQNKQAPFDYSSDERGYDSQTSIKEILDFVKDLPSERLKMLDDELFQFRTGNKRKETPKSLFPSTEKSSHEQTSVSKGLTLNRIKNHLEQLTQDQLRIFEKTIKSQQAQ